MTTGMMNDTDVEADVLGDLEFDPVCEVWTQTIWFGFIKLRQKRCSAVANWVASMPCCGDTAFFCQGHHGNCGGAVWHHCGREYPVSMLTFVRI